MTNQALILSNDTFLMRGSKDTMEFNYQLLVNERLRHRQSIEDLCIVYCDYIGLNDMEANELVELILLYEQSDMKAIGFINSLRFAVMKNDISYIRQVYYWGKNLLTGR